MSSDLLAKLQNRDIDATKTVPLYDSKGHQVYWVGAITQGEEIECNSYLVVDRGKGYLLEPGGYDRFTPVSEKVNSVFPAQSITHLLFSHQDPDVCASISSWLEYNPGITVVCPSLWQRFMPHYMAYNVKYQPMGDDGLILPLQSGGRLQCLSAPYLHSPGNMVTYDSVSGFLFSGDIGAALYTDGVPRLVIEQWDAQVDAMRGFHQRYMSSKRAVSAFLGKVAGLPVRAVLPQHGLIYRDGECEKFFRWLGDLPCGVDYLFPAAS